MESWIARAMQVPPDGEPRQVTPVIDGTDETLPRPVRLQRLLLFGNGWDFCGGVRDVRLNAQ
jgi:hypothetical protein